MEVRKEGQRAIQIVRARFKDDDSDDDDGDDAWRAIHLWKPFDG